MTGRPCTDEVRVKVPSCQNDTLLVGYKLFIRYVIHSYFINMKMFITAVISDEKDQKFFDN